MFFDRSGKYFEYVLQFLRNPDEFPILAKGLLPFVMQEALYFRVHELVDLLDEQSDPTNSMRSLRINPCKLEG